MDNFDDFSPEVFAEKIKKVRKDKHLTQSDVGESLGIKRNTYARYETGDAFPPLWLLYRFSVVFGVSADYLLDPKISNE